MTSVALKRVATNPYVWTKAAALLVLVYLNLGQLLPYVTKLWQDAHTVSTFTITPAMRAELVESLADTAQQHYLDADKGAQIAAFVRKAARAGEYDTLSSPGELTRALTQDMLLASGDLHAAVAFSTPEVPAMPGAGGHAAGAALQDDAPRDDAPPLPLRLIDRLGRTMADFGVEEVSVSASGIGYLKLTGFFAASLAGEKYAAAMGKMANARALIIDLRSNDGGKADGATLLASYFFEQPTHLGDIEAPRTHQRTAVWTCKDVEGKRFGSARPVVILTSRTTAAVAEYFAYTLQTRKRAIVIGRATRGAAQPAASFRLAPHFIAELPVARMVDPVTHGNWEGRGVQPDVAVPAPSALDVATIVILKRQLATETDPARRADLQRWLRDAQ